MAIQLYIGMNMGKVDQFYGKYFLNMDCGKAKPSIRVFPRTYGQLVDTIKEFYDFNKEFGPVEIKNSPHDEITPLSPLRFNALCARLRRLDLQTSTNI